MKISEMITEEMVRGIYPNKISTIIQITDKRIDYYDNQYVPNACSIDLARFLFIDAWDYFNGEGWEICIKDSFVEPFIHVLRQKEVDKYEEEGFNLYKYPSRLHAMAAIVAYMWEQEKKR